MKPVVAISIGDLNGVGPEIALTAHEKVQEFCKPLYFCNRPMLEQAARLLGMEIPKDLEVEYVSGEFTIKPGTISKKSARLSFASFSKAVEMTASGITDAVVTLPINKEAWHKAGIHYSGHTDYLRKRFKKEAIMMLGCDQLYVALYTEHIPLKEVPKAIKKKRLARFLIDLYESVHPLLPIPVLGLNPHAGDGGVLGDEEKKIASAIEAANKKLGKDIFFGPVVPDTAFAPHFRKKVSHIVAMYHDQGLAPLKALYFEESINVSLNLPILRTSVDHGTAYDIAYKGLANITSYLNAVRYAAHHAR